MRKSFIYSHIFEEETANEVRELVNLANARTTPVWMLKSHLNYNAENAEFF